MSHIRESKYTLKVSAHTLCTLLLISLLSLASYAETPEESSDVKSELATETENTNKTSEEVDSPESDNNKKTLSRLEVDLELDQKIETAQGQDRLKLIFDDFKRSAQYFVEEAKDYKDQQSQYFKRGYDSNSQ